MMLPLAALLSLVLLAAAATADPRPSPATINAACSVFTTTYAYPSYDYCVDVLSTSDPPSAAMDGHDLALIAANATARNITHTVDLINDLLYALTRCSEFYGRDMGDKVTSALGDLIAGRSPGEKLYDAYNLGPLNCDIAITQKWGYTKDLLAHENSASMALVLLAKNIAAKLVIPKEEDSSNSTAPPSAIINTTCSSLLYSKYPGYDYCLGVLSSDPSAAASARNTRDLAIIAANATAHNITSTVKLIQGLLSDLADCKVSYSRMGSTLDSALGDLIAAAGHAPAGAATKLGDASNDAVSCDVVMSKRRGAAKNVMHQDNGQNFVSANFASNIAFLSYLLGGF